MTSSLAVHGRGFSRQLNPHETHCLQSSGNYLFSFLGSVNTAPKDAIRISDSEDAEKSVAV